MTYDFSGYATKHNIRCSDGRTILPEAFKECDGMTVPLVWQHVHDSTDNVLGHADLENRPDGVYAYCYLNNTKSAQDAKEIVRHGDVCALSIYANRLQQVGQNVVHGVIREVSLVLAGANPGATIDNLAFAHSDGTTEIAAEEAIIYDVDGSQVLVHADEPEDDEEDDGKTIGEIIDTMNEEQKQALYTLIGLVEEGKSIEHAEKDDDPEEEEKPAEKEEKPAEEEEKPAEEEEKPAEEEEKPAEEEDEFDDDELEKIVDSFSDEQIDAIQQIMEASDAGKNVPEDAARIFSKFSDKQKKIVKYLIENDIDPDKVDEEGDDLKHADGDDRTIQDVLDELSSEQKKAVNTILDALAKGSGPVSKEVSDTFDTLTEDQKNAVYALVGLALEDEEENNNDNVEHSEYEEGETMKYNIFEADPTDDALAHADIEAIFAEAPRVGSLRDAVLEHGITDIEVLFPEAQAVNNEPYMISRRMEWVSTVLNGVHKSPFSRIKSTAVNLTEAQARAKGYIKGRKKIEEQITALRRITTPQTVYKLQKIDRDDVIDITDFDVVAWMKQEMRMMLDEELARAILVGDGRFASDPEKIYEDHIRPVWSDAETYTIHQVVAAADAADYEKIMDDIVRSRKGYKGSGNPVMFIGSDMLTEMRLLKDNDGRFRYDSDQKLAEALRVSKIEEVELFDDLVRTVEGKDRKLVAIILNLMDYTVGANKGGEVNLFDDFDLDYNKLEYLIETRVSGALTMPKSAIAVEIQTNTTSTPETTYVRVTTPVTADIEDYYEQDEYGRYIKTVDVAVIPGKVYYEIGE